MSATETPDRDWDFLVIGGGIAGISAAARLSELGPTLVLEAESSLGYHASGRSAALFEATYGRPATVALNRASHAFHATSDGGVLSPRGLMLLGNPATEAAFAEDMAAMGMEPMSLDDAVAMVPILDARAVDRVGYHAEAWDIDTDLLIGNFARALRRNGGAIETARRVDRIARLEKGWEVGAGDAVWRAAILVDAAGAWADALAGLAGIAPLGLTPMRRSMARIPAPGGHDVRAWPMIFGAGESWYAKPDAGKLIVSPADEDPAEPHDAWADDMVLAEGLARYEAMVTEPVTRVETSWAGLRTFSADRSLVLGPDPDDPTFVWVAGQGGYGFQTAPAASALVADLVAGRTPELEPGIVTALSPARFR